MLQFDSLFFYSLASQVFKMYPLKNYSIAIKIIGTCTYQRCKMFKMRFHADEVAGNSQYINKSSEIYPRTKCCYRLVRQIKQFQQMNNCNYVINVTLFFISFPIQPKTLYYKTLFTTLQQRHQMKINELYREMMYL